MNRTAIALLTLFCLAAQAAPARIKDLVDVQGVRENELFGYGLVVGLPGSGDTERIFFTSQSISGMLGRLGIRIDPKEVRARNVAAVMVTARLPTFSRTGSRLDVTVSSIGNARSLAGGTLLITPLTAGDGAVYAVAQGQVQVGGYEASSSGSSIRKNSPNTGRVPAGCTVEKAVIPDLGKGPVLLQLRRPDFTTATRIAAELEKALGAGSAKALDPAAVEVQLGETYKDNPVGLIARIEEVEVEADTRARVVISERTGTVVAGERVRLRPAAVAHGNLKIQIAQRPAVSQPAPLSRGATTSTPVAQLDADESGRGVAQLPATTTVEELVRALNGLGATPHDLISILQALKSAGALDAELEVI